MRKLLPLLFILIIPLNAKAYDMSLDYSSLMADCVAISDYKCKNRSTAEEEALYQFDQFDENQYTRIVAGSMKKGGENKYSNKIKEEYIDIK